MRIIEELANASPLRPAAKMVYVVTMTHRPISIHDLATKMHLDAKTTAIYCKELQRHGWVDLLNEHGRQRPDAVLPREIETRLASEVNKLIGMAHFRGEETAKTFVDWIIAPTVGLVFDARPDILNNRETGQNLEYDIFAPDFAWALEYQGDQHFGPTPQYPSEKQFIERHKRDLLKVHLSRQNNVRLSAVSKLDLTLDRMLSAIPADIPRRAFDQKGPFVQMLEKVGKEVAGRQDWDRE